MRKATSEGTLWCIRFVFVSFFFFFCLESSAEAFWQPELFVELRTTASSLRLSADQSTELCNVSTGKKFMQVPAGTQLVITCSNRTFYVNGKPLRFQDLSAGVDFVVPDLRTLDKQVSHIDGYLYRGGVRLLPRENGFAVINRVTTEEYLQGVVPQEMPSSWNAEALKAQAVAARTFALRHRRRHERDGFDLCATTHCQQYGGIRAERAETNAAIQATCGEVQVYQGKLIEALFHTDSGGMTENSRDVWGQDISYLHAATEVHRNTQPWEKTLTANECSILLSRHGKNLGQLKKIELSALQLGKSGPDRTASGRVRFVRITGTKGQDIVSGNDLRNWLGLRSTLFDMTLRDGVLFLQGYGWGHGLGLSQWGAKAYAEEQHWTYHQILRHYYAGTTEKKLYCNEGK